MSMKKHTLIAMFIVLLLVLAAACTKNAGTSTGSKDGSQSKVVATDKEDGEIETGEEEGDESSEGTESYNESTGSYEAVGKPGPVSGGASLPKDWPDYVPIMPGFNVTAGSTANPPGAQMMTVGAKGSAVLDTVQEFYMKLEGWKRDDIMKPSFTGSRRQFKLIRGTNEHLIISIKTDQDSTILEMMYNKTMSPPPTIQ